jgi:hypothetical protein
MLRRGANVSAVDERTMNALHYSVESRNMEMFKFLLNSTKLSLHSPTVSGLIYAHKYDCSIARCADVCGKD